MHTQTEVLNRYAALLDYPGDGGAAELAGLMPLLRENCATASDSLAVFADFVADSDRARIEEVYTATFDLRPLCSPYVGYHICGEGYQRSRFLVKLQEIYRDHGFAIEGELADHFAAVLRFLAHAGPDSIEARDLVIDGLLPALEKSLAAFEEPSPYGELLRSLRIWLEQTLECTEPSAAAPQEESVL